MDDSESDRAKQAPANPATSGAPSSGGGSSPDVAAEPSHPAAVPRRSFWRGWGWRIVLSLVIVVVVAGYYVHRCGQVAGFVVLPNTGKGGPFKLVVYLPRLGSLESFRKDQQPAREICRKLGLPEFPDISGIDPDGQKQFYNAFLMLRGEPGNHDKYGLLGQLYDAQKIPQLAVPLYRRAIEMAPHDYEWHYALGLRLAKDAEYEKAKAEFERAAELKPDYAPVWMQLAWRAIERNDREAALSYLDRYIALRPDDPFGYVERAEAHFTGREWKPMQQELEKALSLKQQKKGYLGKKGHRLLGALYNHLGQTEDGRIHLLLAVEQQPGDEMEDPIGRMVTLLATDRYPEVAKFSALLRRAQFREAIEIGEKALTVSESKQYRGQLYCGLAECYRETGDYSRSIAYADQAMRAMPEAPEPHTSLALSFLSVGKWQAAVEAASKALEIAPSLDTALYARGWALVQTAVEESTRPAPLRAKDPENIVRQAVVDLEACVKSKPVKPVYLVALAEAHGMLGHYERAGQLLKTTLRINPNDRQAQTLQKKVESREGFWPTGASITQ